MATATQAITAEAVTTPSLGDGLPALVWGGRPMRPVPSLADPLPGVVRSRVNWVE